MAPEPKLVPEIAIDVPVKSDDVVSEESRESASGGLHICFKDLSYHVPSRHERGERAYLLKGLNGYINTRELTALMGPSGSGKTTLLDVLAGRKNAGVTEGSILFGGRSPSGAFLRRYTGYVEQFDSLIDVLTPREMLLYTAEMKRSIKEPYKEKEAAVDILLDKLALNTCKDTLIGSQMAKGISGGQAKRVNIGIALITNPRVLFLDEPTSGLDSYTSNEVMTVVKSLVSEDTTICATIHSPTAYCFNLFDRLMMLVKGRIAYFGPISGSLQFAVEACPNVKEMTEGYNGAEFLVDLVTEADRQGRSDALSDHYDSSTLCKENELEIDTILATTDEISPEVSAALDAKSSTNTPWWWGLITLLKYRSVRNYKNPAFLGPRVADKVLITLLIMTLYLLIGDDSSPDNLINISAVLFMWTVMPAFGAAAYIPSLVLERNIFVRERADGLYRTITYLLAKIVEEVFLAFVASLPISAYVFYGVQLQGSWAIFWLVYFIVLSIGIVLAYFVAAISPNMDVANALLPTYVVTLLYFAGFLFRFNDMPPWWKWYSYLNFLRYAWTTLMRNQFDAMGDPDGIGGTTILDYYGIKGVNPDAHLAFTMCFFFVFFTAAWLTMTFRKFQDR